MNFPPERTEPLIMALREELQEYGALLRLLEARRAGSSSYQRADIPDLTKEIDRHETILRQSRQRRRDEVRSLVGHDPDFANATIESISLDNLLPHFPVTVAPMIQGLVEEVNQLITKVSRLECKGKSPSPPSFS